MLGKGERGLSLLAFVHLSQESQGGHFSKQSLESIRRIYSKNVVNLCSLVLLSLWYQVMQSSSPAEYTLLAVSN